MNTVLSAAPGWLSLVQGLRRRLRSILDHEARATAPGMSDSAVALAYDAADAEAETLVEVLKALEADGTMAGIEALVAALAERRSGDAADGLQAA